MDSLEADLERARDLDPADLADAIESIGFECTRCGACCTSEADDPHTATVFPDEVREIQKRGDYDWRDVARPMPYGLQESEEGDLGGETFEWALATDGCGDCTFYEEEGGVGACTVHPDRPLICRTYPFSVVLESSASERSSNGTDGAFEGARDDSEPNEGERTDETELAQPMGEAVDREGAVRAHECEGLGRDISREDAEDLAAALKERAIRELEEAIAVRENYAPADPDPGEVVVHDSEGQKRVDGRPLK